MTDKLITPIEIYERIKEDIASNNSQISKFCNNEECSFHYLLMDDYLYLTYSNKENKWNLELFSGSLEEFRKWANDWQNMSDQINHVANMILHQAKSDGSEKIIYYITRDSICTTAREYAIYEAMRIKEQYSLLSIPKAGAHLRYLIDFQKKGKKL